MNVNIDTFQDIVYNEMNLFLLFLQRKDLLIAD